jgi:hypothetical protein
VVTPSGAGGGSADFSIFLTEVLEQITTAFGKLVYLASFHNRDSGRYQADEAAEMFSAYSVHRTLQRAHWKAFHDWQSLALKQKKSDLKRYAEASGGPAPWLALWTDGDAAHRLMPAACAECERTLFVTELGIMLELLAHEGRGAPKALQAGALLFGILAIANLTPRLKAQQRTGGTALAVSVGPEARLSQPQVVIRFVVSVDGAGEVVTQSAVVGAWVRSFPGQQIRLTARSGEIQGPGGPVRGTSIRWSGALAQATGGGQSAACASGSLVSEARQDLVNGWSSSGTLSCAVNFELVNPRDLQPGVYTAVIDLDLQAE